MLAAPRNQADVDAINVVSKDTYSIWIGVTDADKEGTWTDTNGLVITWTPWHKPTEPNGNVRENCVNQYSTKVKKAWNDCSCSREAPFVCERLGT